MILHSDANNAFEGMEATVTLCHRNTPPEQLYAFTKSADIVISATGNSEKNNYVQGVPSRTLFEDTKKRCMYK